MLSFAAANTLLNASKQATASGDGCGKEKRQRPQAGKQGSGSSDGRAARKHADSSRQQAPPGSVCNCKSSVPTSLETQT